MFLRRKSNTGKSLAGAHLMSSDSSTHSLAHLTAITESIHDAIVSIDSRGRILSWNPAAERMFPYVPDQASEQPVTIIIPQRFKQAHEEVARVRRGGPRHR
jgi:PAS domain S-box-containing protein